MSESHLEAPDLTEEPAATAADPTVTPDTASTETTTGAPESGHGTTDDPAFFDEKFDRSKLPPELLPAYNEMHGALTRARQQDTERVKQAESVKFALEDLRSEDPEVRQGALGWLGEAGLLSEEMVAEAFGWEIEPDTEPEDVDPDDPAAIARAEIEAFKAEQAAQQQAAQKAAEEQAWVESEDKRIKSELDELGVTAERDRDLIFANALFAAQKGLTEGIDIKRAHSEFEAAFTERQKAWRDGKSTAQPVAAGGEAATEVPDMDTHEGRVQAMMARLTPGPNG